MGEQKEGRESAFRHWLAKTIDEERPDREDERAGEDRQEDETVAGVLQYADQSGGTAWRMSRTSEEHEDDGQRDSQGHGVPGIAQKLIAADADQGAEEMAAQDIAGTGHGGIRNAV